MLAEIIIPLDVKNFMQHPLVVQAERGWKKCVLQYGGETVLKKLGQAVVKDDNGNDVIVVLSYNFFQQSHFVKIDSSIRYLLPQLRWHEVAWIWVALPLFAVGGMLGALFVGLAGMINCHLYRKWYNEAAAKRYALTGLVSLLAVALYFVVGAFLYCWLSPDKCPH